MQRFIKATLVLWRWPWRGPRRQPGVAEACAGLIGSNGAVNLGRTTTLAAYHDGVEHYVTAFEFLGGGGAVRHADPAAGRADRTSSAAAPGRCSGSRARRTPRRGRLGARSAAAPRAGGARSCSRSASTRSTSPCSRAAAPDVAAWAHGARLPALAGRARGARLLRPAQPDLPRRRLRRRRGRRSAASSSATARPSTSRSRPTTPGCRCASSASASSRATASTPTSSCSPTSSPRCCPAPRDGLTPGAQRSRRRSRCSTTCAPTTAWTGCRQSAWLTKLSIDSAAAGPPLRPRGRRQRPQASRRRSPPGSQRPDSRRRTGIAPCWRRWAQPGRASRSVAAVGIACGAPTRLGDARS